MHWIIVSMKGIFPLMTFLLSDEWHSEIQKHGTPMYIQDEKRGTEYVLLAVNVERYSSEGFRATADSLPFSGVGKTKDEAKNHLFQILTRLCTYISLQSS